ncbi:MAG TPA: folylpolyglutamate synthase/dihydrofolate synthase family protein [Panacibacter sp.]|nr:folylpolyglutamate synthase/dihydrofolate synthase family protein [Panacibacter sp.]HNP45519.1 folylpolyglutamate synthase/dihydrofolate synthase family protein [Panacibacter sp.]
MTYQETIDYLYNALPMFSRIGAAAYKKDLRNTIQLCEALDNPQTKFKSIHVAGTNGKGSVSHMLASVLQAAGYKTGLYTSPHLKDFRERIKINGTLCEEHFVVDFVSEVIPMIESIQPSFFEITVAMAYCYFATQKVDIAIIETGLGGRLDSTNIITPELSVITNIGWDHMNILGDTLEKIAFEKAGIIKDDVPVIVGETMPETKPVFENAAREKHANIFFASEERYVTGWQYEHHILNINVSEKHNGEHRNYQLDLTGIYQTKNLLTVLETLHQLKQKGWALSDETIHKGLAVTKKSTGLHGRWEQVKENPTVILDVAHNVDGIKQIVEQIELSTYNNLHLIIGMVKDKDVDKALSILPKYANYYFTKAQIPRAMTEAELVEKAALLGLQGNAFPEVNIALSHALTHADKNDLIVILGSVFLVGEVST